MTPSRAQFGDWNKPVSAIRPAGSRSAPEAAELGKPQGPRVWLVDARVDGVCVVRLAASASSRLLPDGHRALCALDVQIVHTEVKLASGRLVQTLHLLERDGTALCSARVLMAVSVLFRAAAALEEPPPLAWTRPASAALPAAR